MNLVEHWHRVVGGVVLLVGMMTICIEVSAQSHAAEQGVVYVCLFMHNEDNLLPNLTSEQSRTRYLNNRAALADFCRMLHRNNVPFNWEPEWLFLEAALLWDSPEAMAITGGKNIVRYLKEDLGISIDPHSHEKRGYNYADVAKLIDSLGVTPTNVIGGHVWDPYSANFQNWDRFRLPLQGMTYPWYTWTGEILIGSGTPNHVNDPEPSGIWRPRDRYHYFEDDPGANVYAVGQYTGDMAGARALVDLYKSGAVSPDSILTVTMSTRQGDLPASTASYEDSVITPLLDMQNRGEIRIVTFPELIEIFRTQYDAQGHIYNAPTAAVETGDHPDDETLLSVIPNPTSGDAAIHFSLAQREHVELRVYNALGVQVSVLAEGDLAAGEYAIELDGDHALGSGAYMVHLVTGSSTRMSMFNVVR